MSAEILCYQSGMMPNIHGDAIRPEEDSKESNYNRLFGTPERAARTLEKAQLEILDYCEMVGSRCDECPYEFDRYGCCLPDGFSLLEWLRQDSGASISS